MENKKIWNLILRTNVSANDDPKERFSSDLLSTFVYDDFETARKEMLRVIDRYVRADNGLFDGKGGVTDYEEPIKEILNEVDLYEEGWKLKDEFDMNLSRGTKEELRNFPEKLRSCILGGFIDSPESVEFDSGYVNLSADKTGVHYSVSDGDSESEKQFFIDIDLFDMSEPEKDYGFCCVVRNIEDYRFADEKYFRLVLLSTTMNQPVEFYEDRK